MTRYSTTTIPEVLARMERDRAWLARKMGVSLSLVCRVLDGKRRITPNFVQRACDALGLPESALFGVGVHMRIDNAPGAVVGELMEAAS